MEKLASIIESILFVSGKEIDIKDICEKLQIDKKEIIKTINELQKIYCKESGIHLIMFNNKVQFCSNPANATQVETVLNPIKERELSQSMLETSAIIAYKQPVTRLDVEEIRGVSSEYAIQMLLKHNIIEVVGRKDSIGKPVLFGTTDEFLKRFQLKSLDDLPNYDELIEKIKLIHIEKEDDYLYAKEEYKAENDEDKKENDEEIPEFLKDEEVVTIK